MPDSEPAGTSTGSTAEDDLRASVRFTVHELNNTLSVLRLTAELLADDHLDLEEATTQIREQIDEASRLVESLHRLARGD